MCLAIHKLGSAKLDPQEVLRACGTHPNGVGFAVRNKRGMEIQKGLWTFDQLWRRLVPHMAKELLVHFRTATSGTISDEMCHPFAVGDGAVVHNGVLMGYGTEKQSDTAHFVEEILHPLLSEFPSLLHKPALYTLLEETLAGDKMAIMLPGQPVLRLGKWTEEQGVFYSNLHHRPSWSITSRGFPGGSSPINSFFEDSSTGDEYLGYCEECGKNGVPTRTVCDECMDSWNWGGHRHGLG